LSVPVYRLERWRERALSGIDGSLRKREGDAMSEELAAAMKRIGKAHNGE
jgi:transposase